MPRPILLLVLLLGVAALALGIVSWLGTDPPAGEVVPIAVPRERQAPAPHVIELPQGGVYAGRVVRPDGRSAPHATIVLVAYESGMGQRSRRQPSQEDEEQPIDLASVPAIGYRTASSGKADDEGNFRLAADADAAIQFVAALLPGSMPGLIFVEAPREDLRIVVQEGGWLLGRVVEAETGSPVRGADVAIYLQQHAVQPGWREEGRTPGPASPYAIAMQYVVQELAPHVWPDLFPKGDALHVGTDTDGRFRFGPVSDEVQLEFVVTHPRYMWSDFDVQEGGLSRRTVVKPGETVERTFVLERGMSIDGKVLDENNQGVADVVVDVEHVAQHMQHWWYRIRKRTTRTARDGSFVVGGLSWGPYTVILRHPSFGVEYVPGVPEGSTGLHLEVPSVGGLRGLVEGLPGGLAARTVDVVLDPVGETNAPSTTLQVRLDEHGVFYATGIRPGHWRVWLRAGSRTSLPQEIEIRGLESAEATFRMGGGGALSLQVIDAGGRAVDPASVRLVHVGEDGEERALGRFITRAGRLDTEGLVPGRYLAVIEAAGFAPARTEPFEVHGERRADAGVVTLRRDGQVRVVDVRRADRRPLTEMVHVTIQEEGGEARRLLSGESLPTRVRAGALVVRAHSGELSFERTYEVGEGQTVEVEVLLAP